MAKTGSMIRNQNNDASSKKKFKTCDDDGLGPWSDLNYDVLFLVMMQLGVVDFLAFSGVCKSWRSLALSNRNKFIVSRPPMSICIPAESHEEDYYCYLEDFERRRFKTILPHSAGRTCVGFTCGYLVLFGEKTHDFWLVNLITRHELYFPANPFLEPNYPAAHIKAILVFSPSISGLVFVVLREFKRAVSVFEGRTQSWNHATSTLAIHDLHAFRGKIYTIDCIRRLFEMRLDPKPKLRLLEMKNPPKPNFLHWKFLSSSENLYVLSGGGAYSYEVQELDLVEMKWVSRRKTVKKYGVFVRDLKYGFHVKPESWADPRSQ